MRGRPRAQTYLFDRVISLPDLCWLGIVGREGYLEGERVTYTIRIPANDLLPYFLEACLYRNTLAGRCCMNRVTP